MDMGRRRSPAASSGGCPGHNQRSSDGAHARSARLGDHIDRLYRAAWALSCSREDAEDLVQETYSRVLARPRLLRNEDDPAGSARSRYPSTSSSSPTRRRLQGGGMRDAHPRGHRDEPPLPRAATGCATDRGRLAADVDSPGEDLLARRGLIAVGSLARDGQRREARRRDARPERDPPALIECPDRTSTPAAFRSHAS